MSDSGDRVSRSHSRARSWAALVVFAAALAGCTCLLRAVQIETVAGMLTSQGSDPESAHGPEVRNQLLSQYAVVFPTVVRGYQDPHAVASCLLHWSEESTAPDVLFTIGRRRSRRLDPAQRMRRNALCSTDGSSLEPLFRIDCAAQTEPAPDGVDDVSGSLDCSQSLSVTDRRVLAHAVLQLGDAVYSHVTGMWPTATGAPPGYATDLRTAIARTADVLLHSAEARNASARGQRPVLALSGGAANGAFIAGFVYRLMAIREMARMHYVSVHDDAAVRQIDDGERFDSIVSTSVGSLVGPALDLYFDDARATPTPWSAEERTALTTCLNASHDATDPPTERLAQACALRMLRYFFTYSNEWNLLCIEQGNLAGILGMPDLPPGERRPNVMAFDPMRDRLLTPFFDAFAGRTLSNEVQLEFMSVDVRQRVTLALDERACVGATAEASSRCLRANALASLVEPVLARHVETVYSGLTPAAGAGETGQWLDGGLRTGSPVLRALQLSAWPEVAPRFPDEVGTVVLSVSTHRAEGTPTHARLTLPALAFDTVGNFAEQMRVWELGLIGAVAQVQWAEMAAWRTPVWPAASSVAPNGLTSMSYPSAIPNGGLIDSVVVAENLNAGEPIATQQLGEYSFDPLAMTRLFVEGERSFVSVQPEDRLRRLGWNKVLEWYRVRANSRPIEQDVTHRADLLRQSFDATAYERARNDARSTCMHVCEPNGAQRRAPSRPECDRDLLPTALGAARPTLPW